MPLGVIMDWRQLGELLKISGVAVWRDDLALKGTYQTFRGFRVSFQHPHYVADNYLYLQIQGIRYPLTSWDSHMHVVNINSLRHTCIQHKHKLN